MFCMRLKKFRKIATQRIHHQFHNKYLSLRSSHSSGKKRAAWLSLILRAQLACTRGVGESSTNPLYQKALSAAPRHTGSCSTLPMEPQQRIRFQFGGSPSFWRGIEEKSFQLKFLLVTPLYYCLFRPWQLWTWWYTSRIRRFSSTASTSRWPSSPRRHVTWPSG